MIDNFREFLAGSPYKMDEPCQDTWSYNVTVQLPNILREWYDPDFNDVWSKEARYYDKARLKLAGLVAFKKNCAEAGDALQALKYLIAFFENETRKAGLGKTAKKPQKVVAQSAGAVAGDGVTNLLPTALKIEDLTEGEIEEMHIVKHERNPELRRACIEHYRATHGGRIACAACGMAFDNVYGEIGEGYIEVHHLSPISQSDGVHTVDPKEDLVPLCANCHAMIHRLMRKKNMTGEVFEGNAALTRLCEIIEGHL